MTMTTMTAVKPEIASTLNKRLADTADLQSQLKQAHWNVTGPNFIALHQLFDAQATMVREMVDQIAERMRALQHSPDGTVRSAAANSALDEFPGGLVPGSEAVRLLVERYEAVGAAYKQAAEEAADAGDIATEDLYIELIRNVEQGAYFLRAHLQ